MHPVAAVPVRSRRPVGTVAGLRAWRVVRALAAATLMGAAAGAVAQFPVRPVTLLVPFPAGSTTDTVARLIAQHVTTSLGQPVLVENRPGAEGQLAAQEVAKAAPDGYRVMLATAGNLSILPALRKNPPYDAIADFTPIAEVGRYAFFFYVHPGVPAKTLREFIEHARANPGKLSYGTGNNTGVLAMGQMKALFGLDMVHVPYKGEPPAFLDLAAGRTQAMIATGIGIAHVKEGRLRMLAQLLPRRSPLVPDVPVLSEIGLKDLPVVIWAGVVGPAGVPADAVERLNREFTAVLSRADVQAQAAQIGFSLTYSRPEALAAIIKAQLAAFRALVRDIGIVPE